MKKPIPKPNEVNSNDNLKEQQSTEVETIDQNLTKTHHHHKKEDGHKHGEKEGNHNHFHHKKHDNHVANKTDHLHHVKHSGHPIGGHTGPILGTNEDEIEEHVTTDLSQNGNIEKDPLLFYESHVSEDFYALTWCSLKKEIWKTKEVYGVPIFLTESNVRHLLFEFLFFIIMLAGTVFILLYDTFLHVRFKTASFAIELLRILLVGFAQRLLFPEFTKGIQKLRYALRYGKEFIHPTFAAFISFCQVAMSIVSYGCIVVFMCMSNEALPLVMHFAEMAIIIEIDDWVGEMIVKEYPDENERPEGIDTENFNENMPLANKIALVRDDLHIINDLNIPYTNCFLEYSSKLLSYFPWLWLPLISTLSFEYILHYYQPKMVDFMK